MGRWYDPLPLRVLAAFVLLLVLFFAPVLFGGELLLALDNLRGSPPFQDLPPPDRPGFFLHGDQLEDFIPYFAQVRRSLRQLEWPLLNPLVGAGEPLLANLQAQHFHPFLLLSYPFPLEQAAAIVAALKVLMALVFCFVLFRRLGLGVPAATAGSIAYGTGGFLFLYLPWPHTHSAASLPLLLYAIELCLGRGRRPDLLLLALAIAGLLLGGHPETVLYVAATAAVWLAARLLAGRSSALWRALPRIGLAAGLGAAAVAPVYLPAMLAIEKSERYMLLENRRQRSALPLSEVGRLLADPEVRSNQLEEFSLRALPLVAPNAFGHNRYGRYWGASNIIQDASSFVGQAALLAALLAMLPGRLSGSGRHRFPVERTTIAMAAGAALFVTQPPGLTQLLAHLPVLGHSASQHRRLTLLLGFAVAYLAACTWERWQRRGVSRLATLALAVLLAGVISWAYLAHPDPVKPQALAQLRHFSLASHLGVLGVAAALFVAGGGRGRGWRSWGMCLLVSTELWLVHRDMNPPMPRDLYFPRRESIAFLQQNLGHHRLVGLDQNFRYNLPVVYDLADVRSGNPLQPAAMVRLTRPLRESLYTRRFSVADHPLYDLLGVRYVLVEPGRRLPPPLRLAFTGKLWIYERPRPLGRLYLPSSLRIVRGNLLPELWQISDFASQALAPSSPLADRDWQAANAAAPALAIERLEAARVEATVTLSERRLLASSLYQDGGWRLLIDGRRQPTFVLNGAFVGAWLPPGSSRLELVYRPPGFVAGCALGALALAGLFALALPPPLRTRPVAAPAPPARTAPAIAP